jgi:hypothetical protein
MYSLFTAAFTVITMAFCSPAFSGSTPAGNPSWSLQLRTSGGIAGRGNGNVLVTSDGKLLYEKPGGPPHTRQTCALKLSSEQLRALSEAVKQSRPEGWKLSGLNAAAPDAFGYELELRTSDGKRIFKVKWYDNTRDQLPEDLLRLSEAVSNVRLEAAKKCKS